MEEKALRYNEGKPDWTLIDFESLLPMIQVLSYGSEKYFRDNWKRPWEDPKCQIKSALRHLIAMSDGEEFDKESGLPHAAHVMCNMMFHLYHNKPE